MIDELLGRRVSLRALTLLRVFVGPIVVLHLWPFLDDARHGYVYSDAFHEPYASWYPELPRTLYIALLCIGVVAAIGMTLRLWSRLSTAAAFAVVAYNLFVSTTHFHNNRAYLVIVLAALTAAPRDVGPGWPLWLLRIEASVVYGASGLSKLFDHDWFDGTVSWARVVRVQGQVPGFAVSLLTDRSFHTGAAKVIIFTELFIAFGLWFSRTRLVAVWVAVAFHLAIAVTADVEVFSILGIAALVIWATPSTGDRTAVIPQPWARVADHLDWLGRFRIEQGPALQVVDRDGRVLTGRTAAVLVLSRLPMTAWFVLPFAVLRACTRRRRRRATCR